MENIHTRNPQENQLIQGVSVGGLQKEGALLVISASRLAQTEPILQLYDLKVPHS